MTLRLTVEVLRRGDPARAETLGVIEIENTQTVRAAGPNDEHLYEVRCTPGDASTDRLALPLPRLVGALPRRARHPRHEAEGLVTEILAAAKWPTNAAMIADVAALGYLDGTVLDATYGMKGGFWTRYRPELLTTNDLNHPADHAWDYRAMPVADGAFDVVVFDPPYRLGGTPDRPDDPRYGCEAYVGREARLADIVAGAVECYRVCAKFLLVKVMDAVEGGKVRWQTDLVTQAIEAKGGTKVDRFDFLKPQRPQPGGRSQRRARRNYSTLLVFERPKKDRV